MIQQFTNSRGEALAFTDTREAHIATKCQPRDIRITQGEDSRRNREEIAIDIRIGQGLPAIGAARGLLHE
jgi:hypothetical protein